MKVLEAGRHPYIGVARLAACAVAALLLAALPVQAQAVSTPATTTPATTTLTVHVLNVAEGGTVRLGLYDRAGYPDDDSKPVTSADVKASAGETVVVLRDVPPGVYAIEAYQDVNDNDKMDTTWLGLPLEPYGFSRDARPFLSKPSFSQVRFALAAGEQSQTLHMQNGASVVASK